MSTAQLPPKYVPYSESVEVEQLDEQHVFQEIAATMRHISETMNDRARHAARSVHAKSHGLLRDELHAYENLPPALAQGLFAKAALSGNS